MNDSEYDDPEESVKGDPLQNPRHTSPHSPMTNFGLSMCILKNLMTSHPSKSCGTFLRRGTYVPSTRVLYLA